MVNKNVLFVSVINFDKLLQIQNLTWENKLRSSIALIIIYIFVFIIPVIDYIIFYLRTFHVIF